MFKNLIKLQYGMLIGKSLCRRIIGNYSIQSLAGKKEKQKKLKKNLSLKQITQLMNRENENFNDLNQLMKEGKLEQYYKEKNIVDLKVEEIFFLAAHHELFQFSSSMCYEAIISHPQLDCCSSFTLARDLRYLKNERCQLKLITFFNQESQFMTINELIFCLKMIQEFKQFIKETLVNIKIIKARANEAQPFDCLQLLYLCDQLWVLEDHFNIDQLKKRVVELEKIFIQSSSNKLPQIKYYFFIETLQKTLNIQLSNNDKEQRQKTVARKITSAKTDEELQYSLKLISIYSQFTFLIRIDRLKLDLYLKYLRFLIKEKSNNPNFEPISHQVPLIIPQIKIKNELYKIMKLRDELGLDSSKQIGKLMKKVISADLSSLHELIKYTIDQIEDDAVLKELQSIVISKFNLNRKKLQVPSTQKLIQKYDLIQIMKILAIMQDTKVGTETFKKLSLRFIFHLIQQQQLIKNLSGQSQIMFIIEAYKIIGRNTIAQKLETRLVNLTLIAFANNFVSPQTLLKFATMMSNARFGNRHIWYAIQNQFTEIASTKKNQKTRQYLAKSIEQFVFMDLGSAKCFTALGLEPISKKEYMEKQRKIKQSIKEKEALLKNGLNET